MLADTGARRAMTVLVVVSALAMLVVWINVYFHLGAPDIDVSYVVGRFSLLLTFVSVISLIAERVRGQVPWAASACAAVAWLGVLLAKGLGTGATSYPWLIVAVAAGLAMAAIVATDRRAELVRAAVVVGIAGGIGFLTLA